MPGAELLLSPLPEADPGDDPGTALFLRLKKQYGLYQSGEVAAALARLPASADHIVEGLIPPRSVNVLAGESGIGKSSLSYQLGLAVAAGVPFLGMPTRTGNVLFVDYENSLAESRWIIDQQCEHLGLDRHPYRFLLWPMHLDPFQEQVEDVIRKLAPDLVILDSLRSFSPKMESDNVAAVRQIRRLRLIAALKGSSFLLVHHLRKQRTLGGLEQGQTIDWLLQVAGVRALINQTDVRLAFARRERSEEGELVLRGHFRARGEIGPFLLRRKMANGDGEPLGYERFTPVPSLLENPDQEAAFERLPDSFQFGEARRMLGKPAESTNLFIHKLMRLGLVSKVARGKYQRAACACQAAEAGQALTTQ